MFAPSARLALLVLCVTVLATRTNAAEPPAPKFRPEYTAFPDIKPPERVREETAPDGTTRRVASRGLLTEFPSLPPLPAGAPLLRKVQYEQARAGLDYINYRSRARWSEELDRGSSEACDPEWLSIATRLFPLAAEYETKLANRVMWYETRVRLFKEVEERTVVHIRNGYLQPPALNVIRFYRLGAEAELIELLADVKWFGAAADPPQMVPPQPPGTVVVPAPNPNRQKPLEIAPNPRRIYPSGYTAFPDLTWDAPHFNRRGGGPLGEAPDDLPALAADASKLRKLQRESTLEALAFVSSVSRIRVITGAEPSGPGFEFAAEAYRLASGLEARPSDRLTWYEARVRVLKGWERFTEIRVANGSKPISDYYVALFDHLQAEVDLIRLQNAIGKVGETKRDADKREEIKIGALIAPAYTAFPDIKGPTREVKGKRDNGETVYKWKGMVPRPELAAVGASAPTLRKLRFEQASEGLEYIDRSHRVLLDDPYYVDLLMYPIFIAEVYRVAAGLENEHTRRVLWYEQQVRDGKLIEQYVEERVQRGSVAPQSLFHLRVYRLKAETELLKPKFTTEESR